MISKKEPDLEQEDVVVLTQSAMADVRPIGLINWLGMWTLMAKEVARFMKVPLQTIFSPLLMTFLFYAVFSVSERKGDGMIGGMAYLDFLLPGLIIMAIAQNAFINTSSSMIFSKVHGHIVDILVPPLSPFELMMGYVFGGVVRGLIVGGVAVAVMSFVRPLHMQAPLFVLYFSVMGSLMMALGGVITGIWGKKFEHMMAIQNFIVFPATFLSGSFYSVKALPETWQLACTLNPVFYMIDGFRYGFTGYADASVYTGISFLLVINMLLFNIAYMMFANSRALRP